MGSRRVLIGCGITGAALIVIVVVGGVIAWWSLTAPAPIPASESLIDSTAAGCAVLTLSPDNPWIADLLASLGPIAPRRARPSDMFPIQAIWSAATRPDGGLDQTMFISVSPKGRLVGLLLDGAFWRAGRSGDGGVAREEYGGEGISQFRGKRGLAGYVFVRGNTLVWSSGLDASRRAVDLMNAPAAGAPARRPPLADLLPDPDGHVAIGAVDNAEGALAAVLATLSMAPTALAGDDLRQVSALSFAFDVVSGDAAAGSIVVRFRDGTQEEAIASVTAGIAQGLQGVTLARMTIETATRAEPLQGVIAVKAEGLRSVGGWIADKAILAGPFLEGIR